MENYENAEDRFGRRVRQEREARGWTQADLAKRLEAEGVTLHPSAIAKIELRDADRPRAIRLEEALALAGVFGLIADEMVNSSDDRIRWSVRRMDDWFESLSDVLEEGRDLVIEAEVVISASDPDQRDRAKALLQPDARSALIEDALSQMNRILSYLRHPARREDLTWALQDDDDSSS